MSFGLEHNDLEPYGVTRATDTAGLLYPPLMPASDINSMFRYSNFTHPIPYPRLFKDVKQFADKNPHWDRPISAEAYARLTPAFALGTKFLQHSLWFAYTLRNAPTKTCMIHGKRQNAFIPPSHPFTDAQRTLITQQIAAAADQIRFVTGISADQIGASAMTSELKTFWISRASGSPQKMHSGDPGVRYIICIPREAIELVESDAWLHMSESARKRFLFGVATALVHETMHVLYYARHVDAAAGLMVISPGEEPCFSTTGSLSLGPELGNAWEIFFFGGVVEIPFDGPFAATGNVNLHTSGFRVDQVDDHNNDGEGTRYRFSTLALQLRGLDAEQAETGDEFLSPWNHIKNQVVVSLGLEQFFDPARWAQFERALSLTPRGTRLPGREAMVGRSGDAGDGKTLAVGESPFQLHVAPNRYRQTIMSDRGDGVDDRSNDRHGRGEYDRRYDEMLRLCYNGGFHRLPGDDGLDEYDITKSGTTGDKDSG